MIVNKWDNEAEYSFTDELNADQWAWQFLRRNPGYQKEWLKFRETWQALEADYGQPPNRDMCAWKLDPRAWVPVAECSNSDCRIDDDKVLIECAMGARWGFYKHPPDPQDQDPVADERLVWRDQPKVSLPVIEADWMNTNPAKVALAFELDMPLAVQLDQAKRQLQILQRERVKEGRVTVKRVSQMKQRWRIMLRLLDAQAAGDLSAAFGSFNSGQNDLEQAVTLSVSGYLDLLRYPD